MPTFSAAVAARARGSAPGRTARACFSLRASGARRGAGRGFTLIELLVVIAIIALLVTILVPSLKSAKGLAQAAVCATNVKNLGSTFYLYGHDYKGSLPRYRHYNSDGVALTAGYEWHRFYYPYISTQWVGRFQDDVRKVAPIFDCPTTKTVVWQCGYVGIDSYDAYEHAGTRPKHFDYGIWTDIAGWNAEPHRMSSLAPGQELVSEAYEWNPWYSWGGPGARGYNQCRVRPPAILVPSYNVGDHHNGSVNTLYVDGSVDRVDYR